jgi:hypothetical protein
MVFAVHRRTTQGYTHMRGSMLGPTTMAIGVRYTLVCRGHCGEHVDACDFIRVFGCARSEDVSKQPCAE